MRSWPLLLAALPALPLSGQPGAPHKPHRFDAAVEAILAPSDDPRYAARNPAVHEPRIIIRNKGTEPLEGISIRYGTVGFRQRMYAWTGRLPMGATTEITLPHLIDMAPGLNTFSVTLGDPNGKKDRNRADNTLSTAFTAADCWGSPLTVRLRTRPGNGGALRIESTRGLVALQRAWPAGADTVLRETLQLASGSYLVFLTDSAMGEGAALRVHTGAGDLVKVLHGGRGKDPVYQFKVEASLTPAVEPLGDARLVRLPGSDAALVDAWWPRDARILVTGANDAVALTEPVTAERETVLRIDLSALASGSYTVRLTDATGEVLLGRIDR